MFVTQRNAIRGLSVREFKARCTHCRLLKTMFNVGLYALRQHDFAEHSHLAYESLYHQVKNNENYKLLSTDIAQPTLHVVDRSFKSFIKLTVKDKQGYQHFTGCQVRLARSQNSQERNYWNQTAKYTSTG